MSGSWVCVSPCMLALQRIVCVNKALLSTSFVLHCWNYVIKTFAQNTHEIPDCTGAAPVDRHYLCRNKTRI